MRYVESRCEKHDRNEAYRIYVTDCLKIIGRIDQRYYDLVNPKKVVEIRSADEIIASISEKLAKVGGEPGSI